MSKYKTFPDAEEIHLPSAPLVRVLAQVRFETILAIQNQASLAPFQDAIRDNYPLLRSERSKTVVQGPEGTIAIDQPPVWKFSDLSNKWRVSLASDFIALETSAYKSRADFLARFDLILAAFTRSLKPGVFTRVGIRYLNRLSGGDTLAAIPQLIRSELVGVTNSDIPAEITVSEAVYKINDSQLYARWGLLSANSTMDPNVLEPLDQPSWILDIDSANQVAGPWDLDEVRCRLNTLAANSHNFFRWAVKDEFLRFFGGGTK